MPQVPDRPERDSRDRSESSRISRSLFHVLVRRCNRLAYWYAGAHRTLDDPSHPDKLACAAHCLRELMEKFPECAGLTVVDVAGNAASVLRLIGEDFDNLLGRSEAAAKGWEDFLDGPTREFLLSLRQRIDEFDTNANHRTRQMQQTIRVLVPGGTAVPDVHHRPFLRSWNELRQYFIGVAHHRNTAEESDFREHVEELERMIVTQLAPTPTDDMDLIDRMIEEAERGN